MTMLWWMRWPRHITVWEWHDKRAEFWLENGEGRDHLDEQAEYNITIVESTGKSLFWNYSDKLEGHIKINLKEWGRREKREFGRYWYGFENNIKIYINE
jgi:hypothetical protein